MFMPIQRKKCDLGIEIYEVIKHMASYMPELSDKTIFFNNFCKLCKLSH